MCEPLPLSAIHTERHSSITWNANVILTTLALLIVPEDNFLCSQWWKFHQSDIISVSELVQIKSYYHSVLTLFMCIYSIAAMCIHIKSNSQFTSSIKAHLRWFFPCIDFECTCQIDIICKQLGFIIAIPVWGVKWAYIWHFQISMNRIQ